jgi:hypothetical protein
LYSYRERERGLVGLRVALAVFLEPQHGTEPHAAAPRVRERFLPALAVAATGRERKLRTTVAAACFTVALINPLAHANISPNANDSCALIRKMTPAGQEIQLLQLMRFYFNIRRWDAGFTKPIETGCFF